MGIFFNDGIGISNAANKSQQIVGIYKNGPALSNPTICALKKYLQNVKIYIYLCVGDSFLILRSNLYLAT